MSKSEEKYLTTLPEEEKASNKKWRKANIYVGVVAAATLGAVLLPPLTLPLAAVAFLAAGFCLNAVREAHWVDNKNYSAAKKREKNKQTAVKDSYSNPGASAHLKHSLVGSSVNHSLAGEDKVAAQAILDHLSHALHDPEMSDQASQLLNRLVKASAESSENLNDTKPVSKAAKAKIARQPGVGMH